MLSPRRQPGLRARMAIAALLLAVVYVVLIALLAAAAIGGFVVAVVVVTAFVAQYFTCERLVLSGLGARPVDAEQAPELHAAVTRLCVAAEMPMPRLALAPSAMPNAFTVGRTPSSATVCVTTGLLQALDGPQLEAVLAHELAHIASRDVTVMTIASGSAAIAAAFVQRNARARRRRAGAGAGEAVTPGAIVVIVSGLLFLLSYVVTQALSRDRELAADQAAAHLTGDPAALADALGAIAAAIQELSPVPLTEASGELAAFYIVGPDVTATIATLCPTHPPLSERLQALGMGVGTASPDVTDGALPADSSPGRRTVRYSHRLG